MNTVAYMLAMAPDYAGSAEAVYAIVGNTVQDYPARQPPTQLRTAVALLVGWLKWAALVAGVIGLIVCGIMMILGRRGKSQTAADGAAGIPWVLGGLTLIAFATVIVNEFV